MPAGTVGGDFGVIAPPAPTSYCATAAGLSGLGCVTPTYTDLPFGETVTPPSSPMSCTVGVAFGASVPPPGTMSNWATLLKMRLT